MNYILFVGEHPKTFDVRWHTHESWELIYCTSGHGAFQFQDGRSISYQAGEIVVIPPLVVHANSSECGFTNIHLNLAEPAFSFPAAFKIQDENESFLKSFTEARMYYVSDYNKKELVLAALGELIASYVVSFKSNTEYSEMVERIRNTILKSYTSTEFELDEFIRSLPFNYDYLRKSFKKEIGLSPLEYMTSLRMKNAERLLSTVWTNGFSISEIAHMCGFDNALYFSRVFRKYFGCSPTQYLKNDRQIHLQDPGRKELLTEDRN